MYMDFLVELVYIRPIRLCTSDEFLCKTVFCPYNSVSDTFTMRDGLEWTV